MTKFSPQVREGAVRMVAEHRADYGSEWEVMKSIAAKIGCLLETLLPTNAKSSALNQLVLNSA